MNTRKLLSRNISAHQSRGFRHFGKIPWQSGLTLGLIGLGAAQAQAEGIRNPPAGEFGLERAGGRIAQVDDASAVTHNPANLVDLQQLSLSLSPNFVYISSKFQSSTSGLTATTYEPWKTLPNFFASCPVIPDKVVAGLGITVPYGLSNEWKEQGAFTDNSSPLTLRYQAPISSELKTINFNPSLAIRLCEHVTFGAGLDVMWSQLKFRQIYPSTFVFGTGTDGVASAKGDGVGLGGNFGLTWQVTEQQRLAVTYRSPMSIDYGGSLDTSNVPAAFAHSSFQSNIKYPTILGVGYGFQLMENVRAEIDGEWLEFSNFKTLPLNIPNGPPFLPTGIAQNWRNTFTIGLGGDWSFSPGWSLGASYQYYESPVPDQTISTTIPDANQNALTVGVRYHEGHHSLGAAFSEVLYDHRVITNNQNPVFNGKYGVTVHLFAFTYAYSF